MTQNYVTYLREQDYTVKGQPDIKVLSSETEFEPTMFLTTQTTPKLTSLP